MPRKYKCQLYMENTEQFAQSLLDTAHHAIGTEVLERLYKDQHMLYHDGEFVQGCDICDWERKEYG